MAPERKGGNIQILYNHTSCSSLIKGETQTFPMCGNVNTAPQVSLCDDQNYITALAAIKKTEVIEITVLSFLNYTNN